MHVQTPLQWSAVQQVEQEVVFYTILYSQLCSGILTSRPQHNLTKCLILFRKCDAKYMKNSRENNIKKSTTSYSLRKDSQQRNYIQVGWFQFYVFHDAFAVRLRCFDVDDWDVVFDSCLLVRLTVHLMQIYSNQYYMMRCETMFFCVILFRKLMRVFGGVLFI